MLRIYCLTMRCVVALDHFGALDQRALALSVAAVAGIVWHFRRRWRPHFAFGTVLQLSTAVSAAAAMLVVSGCAVFVLASVGTVALNAAIATTHRSVCGNSPLLGWRREELAALGNKELKATN